MCFMSSTPDTPPIPSTVPDPASDVDPGVKAARKSAQSKARGAAGYTSTILTGAMGDTSQANTTGKALLGQ